jgi:hypothetical protein
MAVKEYQTEQEVPQLPWVETPLRESYALSEAAGWYGHTFSTYPCYASTLLPLNTYLVL